MIFFPEKSRKEKKIEQTLLQNYDRYYRLAYSYVHCEADAADIVQNGAYKAILHSDTLRTEEYVSTWVYRIMLNETFRFLKKERPLISLEELDVDKGREDTYENLDLRRALNALAEKDKAVIELRYFDDMKLTDIARVLDENVNTVKSRLYRGLRKLKLELEDVGQWE